MQNNFVCFSCKSKSIEFTILHCDHIICSQCLDNNIKNFTEISIVQCTCGMKTFCNEDSMRNSLRTPQMAEINNELSKIKQLQDSNTQVSNFILKQSDISSKQNTFLKNKENLNTENLNYFLNPTNNNGYSKSFLKTQPLNIDQSLFFMKSQQQHLQDDNNKVVRAVKSVRSIRSLSPSQKVSEKVSPRKVKCRKSPKKVISRIYTSHVENPSAQSLNPMARQIRKQLKYLQIEHRKQLQRCQKTFKKVIKEIESQFKKLISSLQKFYLENNVDISNNQVNTLFKMQSMSKIIKQRYESKIGKKLNIINEKLNSHLKDKAQKIFDKQIQKRQTILMIKDSGQKIQVTNQRKNNNILKRSQSRKVKQCALYLAISPKSKNDKVINYIDVIRKQQPCKNNSKKNLIKKTIKGQKIRIY